MTLLQVLLVVVLVVVLLGLLPTWPYSAHWGYAPSGLGLVILLVVILVLFGRF